MVTSHSGQVLGLIQYSHTQLSNIDKFNYLNSLLEKGAADAVAGLALTSANCEEAVSVLKQQIVSKIMDDLLSLEVNTQLEGSSSFTFLWKLASEIYFFGHIL